MTTKVFSIPQSIAEDFANTINTVKNNVGSLNYQVVPLNAIEFDPMNPRELNITREDVVNGLNQNDALYETKAKELESLQQMAETIKKYGVRNAVEIYKFGTNYRLIHGERRCLSSILAGKSDIPAKVLSEKPNNLDIRLLQLIENVQRENLSLYEMLNNIKLVIDEYKKNVDPAVIINANLLEQLLNRSKTQCFNFLAVLNASEDIQTCIREGKINNLEKAATIASVKDPAKKQTLLNACLNGASLKQLKQATKQQKALNTAVLSLNQKKHKPGKKSSKINLGETKSKEVIIKLIQLVTNLPEYTNIATNFKQFTYEDFDSCSIAFKHLVTLMEKIEISKT